MKVCVLGSGSRGNAVYVEGNSSALLIDNGFSAKELLRRMERAGLDPDGLAGICVTHEHNDHIGGVGVLSRRLKLAVHGNCATLRAGARKMGKLHRITEFANGERFRVGDLEVRSFQVSHDTADPVGYVITDGRVNLGYCTDSGKVTHLMARRLLECNGLILEFNHDLEMLKNGPYPLPLQQRVRSSQGHLSNEDAAEFLEWIMEEGADLELVVQAHLSETNNTPMLATTAATERVADWGGVTRVVAGQDNPTDLFCL